MQAVTGVSLEQAVDALETAGWNTKLASLVAAMHGPPYGHVGSRRRRGSLRQALSLSGTSPADGPGQGTSSGHGIPGPLDRDGDDG